MKAVVTGGTGFIGRRLCVRLLRAGVAVTVLSRDAYEAQRTLLPTVRMGTRAAAGASGLRALDWDSPDQWRPAVADADVVFHLAGASVAGERWTPEYKDEILTSRVETTRAIVDAGPQALISASAVGYYGDRKDAAAEDAPPGDDFLARVCVAWEEEAERAAAAGARVCRMRFGAVLGPDGGMLQEMLHPAMLPFSPWQLGLGGPLGSGRQWVSWVHIDDVLRLLLLCGLERPDARGPVNVVSPNPVTAAQFAHALGRALHKPSLVPVPAFALRAVVGEMTDSLLSSQRAVPEAAQRLGYEFRFPELDAALADILAPERRKSRRNSVQ